MSIYFSYHPLNIDFSPLMFLIQSSCFPPTHSSWAAISTPVALFVMVHCSCYCLFNSSVKKSFTCQLVRIVWDWPLDRESLETQTWPLPRVTFSYISDLFEAGEWFKIGHLSQRRRNIIWHPLYGESKKKWYKWIDKTETNSQTQRMNLWLPGGRLEWRKN